MVSILVLLFLALIAWFWFDSVRAKEKAMMASAQACQQIQAQLLDQTASLKSIKLSRDQRGRTVLERTYNFDFSQNREERHQGRVIIRGLQIENIYLDKEDGTTIL
jgi:hypothetical protein